MEILEIVTQLAVIAGVAFTIYSVNSWRREHIEKRRIELAEDTLAMFYEAKDAIRYVRHPASFGYETAEVKQQEGESESEWQARKKASIVFYRLNNDQEIFNNIHALRYRFMAQIGSVEAEPFQELRKIIADIKSSASILARLWSKEHFRNNAQQNEHFKKVREHEAIFWEGMSDEDSVNKHLDSVLNKIEATCQQIIAGK